MTLYYIDPSAWIKRHFYEAASEAVGKLFGTAEAIACCRLGLVEMTATIARKSRAESLEPSVVQEIIRNVKADFAAFEVAPVDEALIEAATELATQYCRRTLDAIHLAAALSHRRPADAVIVVSSDLELLAAARGEGLATLDPTTLPG